MTKKSLKVIQDDEALIPLKAVATMLGLSTATIRLGKADTEGLTRIRQGKKLFLIKGEVLAHRDNLIKASRQSKETLKDAHALL